MRNISILVMAIIAALFAPSSSAEEPSTSSKVLKGHAGEILSIAFSPDCRRLASSSGTFKGFRTGELILWDTDTGKPIKSFQDPKCPVMTVAFAPKGNLLAIGNEYGRVIIWDLPTGTQKEISGDSLDKIRSIAFSPDGKLLAVKSDKLRLFETKSWSLLKEISEVGGGWSITFTPDSTLLAIGGSNGKIELWDVETKRLRTSLKGSSGGWWASPMSLPSAVLSVSVSPDGRLLAAGGAGGTVEVWELHTGKSYWYAERPAGLMVCSLSFSPNSKELALGSYSPNVVVLASENGEFKREFIGHTDSISSVAYSSDGKYLASGSYDKTARIWMALPDASRPSLPKR